MFCTQCGIQLGEQEPNFCPACGKSTGRASQYSFAQTGRRLERPLEGRRFGGVCAAFANYLDVDVTLVRVLAVIGAFFSLGTGILAYFIASIIIPNEEPRRYPSASPVTESRP
ncbi:MAG: PspC domain-containing protein [Acidobacteriota bacterium]